MYSKLALAGIQHRPSRAVRSVILIAVCLTPVLLAVGLGHQAATAHSSSSARIALEALKPLFRRLASAFLIACAAITFLSMWDRVRSREYEIGVLRFLGASKILVIAIVSSEAAVVSLGGALLAVAISQSLLAWLNSVFTTAPPYWIGA